MRNFTTSLQLIAATAMLTATGCTPAIYTNIQKSYPARTEESPVLVYDLADTVPAPAQTLGSVWIKDSGFSTGCSYENIIRLAKNETNKIGGNGLHVVWHKKPAGWVNPATRSQRTCSCSRIRCTRHRTREMRRRSKPGSRSTAGHQR